MAETKFVLALIWNPGIHSYLLTNCQSSGLDDPMIKEPFETALVPGSGSGHSVSKSVAHSRSDPNDWAVMPLNVQAEAS